MSPLRQAFSLFRRPLLAGPHASSSFVHHALRSRTLPPPHLRQTARAFSSSRRELQEVPPVAACRQADQASLSTSEASGAPATQPQTHITLEQPEPKLSLTFTCTVEACGHRSTHQFTKRSYEKGIVIVQCPGCKNRHLIADHLGWFKESTQDGKLKTVEDLLRAKGETVRRGRIDAGGVVEYAPE